MKHFTQFILTALFLCCFSGGIFAQASRTITGHNNNLLNADWGAVGATQLPTAMTGFADGISEPAGPNRPNERILSNAIFSQNTLANDPRGLSAYCWAWGQFIDHDITLVNDNPNEGISISVPAGDVFFDPNGTGAASISFHRSEFDPNTGTSVYNPRQFVNSITAFIDASAVYGSDVDRASWLRAYYGGRLKVSSGNLLPWNTTTGEYDAPVDPSVPGMAMALPFVEKWFVAGDVRANENPFLTGMHTLFVREHNRLCEELKLENPDWTDEMLYQQARRLVGAEMQAIVYEEWLPAMGVDLPPYNGYDLFVNPGIMNVFSAAAYRYGHTTINNLLVRMDNDGNYLPAGNISLKDAFFNPGAIRDVDGIEPYLIGMATMVQQDFDCKVIDDLRNFLFGPPGAGGLDLVSINIARGRERGLPDYNTIRAEFGLSQVTTFSEMTSDPLMNQTLEFIYGDINDIDPWVGMLAENHMPDALFGNTAMTIIEDQFMALRDGDRFYYENDPFISVDRKEAIRNTKLADIIRRNSPITIVQDEIFVAEPLVTSTHTAANTALDFALYPNPVQEAFSLRVLSEKPQAAQLQIVDLQGRLILEERATLQSGNNTLTLNMPTASAPGLYLIRILTETQSGYQQFIKL
ncbi:MAG: peroxidase family protein [Saprospiraceae bacterium]